MAEIKEWVRVSHAANGTTTVTVSRVEDNLSVKWSAKVWGGGIKKGVAEARLGCRRAMEDLKTALEELEQEEDEAA